MCVCLSWFPFLSVSPLFVFVLDLLASPRRVHGTSSYVQHYEAMKSSNCEGDPFLYVHKLFWMLLSQLHTHDLLERLNIWILLKSQYWFVIWIYIWGWRQSKPTNVGGETKGFAAANWKCLIRVHSRTGQDCTANKCRPHNPVGTVRLSKGRTAIPAIGFIQYRDEKGRGSFQKKKTHSAGEKL